MKEKFLLHLTDDEVILYKGVSEKLYSSKESFEKSHATLKSFLVTDASLDLLIDRSNQDIYEEKLPPLLPWDRWQLLFHKKKSCSVQGGFAGFQLLKEGKESYLRWIHIALDDPLASWIALAIAHSGKIFFMTLEAYGLLKQHATLSKTYQMFICPLHSLKKRQVIFKGKHLLLSRLFQREEEIKTSLHFLSRTNPGIHDDLEILIFEPETVRQFIATLQTPSFPLQAVDLSTYPWPKWGRGGLLTAMLAWIGIELYQGIKLMGTTRSIVSDIQFLKEESQALHSRLQNQNVSLWRKAIDSYTALRLCQMDPLEDFDILAKLLHKNPIYLTNITWLQSEKRDITLTFLMKNKPKDALIPQLEEFIAATRKHFPDSTVQVVLAPFNSSPHEVFKGASNMSSPQVQVQIIGP